VWLCVFVSVCGRQKNGNTAIVSQTIPDLGEMTFLANIIGKK